MDILYMMHAFHRINTLWLPRISSALLIYALLFQISDKSIIPVLLCAAPALFYIIIFLGLQTVLKGTEVNLSSFFQRPANIATFSRSLFVLAGLICGYFWLRYEVKVLQVFSFILIIFGFTADLLDGWLARHEKEKPASAEWGGWYDAETDAVLLLLTCIFIVEFDYIPGYFIIPGLLRYLFGLIYSFFPTDFLSPKWYHWYSKTVAAVFESVIALLWCTLLLAGESVFLNSFLSVQINIFYPLSILLILSSFIIESIYRLKVILNAVPSGYRRGILRSFLIYYRVPFRQRSMQRFYSRFLAPTDLAFDVGAHIGNRTGVFLELGAEVVCFEPQPACRGLLELWFGSNKMVHLNFNAIGAEDKKIELIMSKKNPTLASTDLDWVKDLQNQSEFKGIQWSDSYLTELTTLDSMIMKYGKPRFIKIDTEGSESSVLQGLNYAADYISFEFLPSQKERALRCLIRLQEIGNYIFNYSVGESMKFSLASEVDLKNMLLFVESYPSKGKSGDIYAIKQESD